MSCLCRLTSNRVDREGVRYISSRLRGLLPYTRCGRQVACLDEGEAPIIHFGFCRMAALDLFFVCFFLPPRSRVGRHIPPALLSGPFPRAAGFCQSLPHCSGFLCSAAQTMSFIFSASFYIAALFALVRLFSFFLFCGARSAIDHRAVGSAAAEVGNGNVETQTAGLSQSPRLKCSSPSVSPPPTRRGAFRSVWSPITQARKQ